MNKMMTREEAIEILNWYANSDLFTDKCQEAHRVALSALRPVSRKQVERMRGEWVRESTPKLLKDNTISHCSRCWHRVYRPEEYTRFCPHCGAPMTDVAMEMVMLRLEALHESP